LCLSSWIDPLTGWSDSFATQRGIPSFPPTDQKDSRRADRPQSQNRENSLFFRSLTVVQLAINLRSAR
jgi:hypothetical protein